MPRPGWALVPALLLVAAPALSVGEALLRGEVADAGGVGLAGAVVYLAGAQVGALTNATGRFELPAPAAADVLVADLEGHFPSLRHVDGAASGALDTRLRPIPPDQPREEAIHLAAAFPAIAPPTVLNATEDAAPMASNVLRMDFSLRAGAAAASVVVQWPDAATKLRADVVHLGSGQRLGYRFGGPPIAFALPYGMLATYPGDYQLEVRTTETPAGALDVTADVVVRYAPQQPKRVEGRPPEVIDPVAELPGRTAPHPSMDIVSVAFTNETHDQVEVELALAELNDTAPRKPNYAAWTVHWRYGDARYYVAYVQPARERPQSVTQEHFLLGHCDDTSCDRDRVIPGEARAGAPGLLRFFVPKADVGSPANGTALEAPHAVAFESLLDSKFLSAEMQDPSDRTAEGASYVVGASQYTVPPSVVQALREAAAAEAAARRSLAEENATEPPPAVPPAEEPPGAAPSALPAWLLPAGALALAALAVAAVLAARRRRADDGKYQRVRVLGEGANGITYLARHRELGKLVAVKEVLPQAADPKAAERLVREARIGGKLHHPNVVDIYDIEPRPGGVAIIMEYVEGGSLQDLLDRQPVLPLPRAARLWDEVLAGLAAIHAAGVVHRDVKPSNILLTRQGHAKLADFGVAHSMREKTLLTSPGTPVGTPMYMAPEQRFGAEPTPASDIYAVAAVAYRMLSGCTHLDVEAGMGAVLQVAPRRDLSVPAVPAAVNALLARALSADPRARPAGAAAFRAELRVAMGMGPAVPAGPAMPPRGAATVRVGSRPQP